MNMSSNPFKAVLFRSQSCCQASLSTWTNLLCPHSIKHKKTRGIIH